MPVVSEFNGIAILMHYEKGERHHTPHFHVLYGSSEAVVTLNGEIMEGYLPAEGAQSAPRTRTPRSGTAVRSPQ